MYVRTYYVYVCTCILHVYLRIYTYIHTLNRDFVLRSFRKDFPHIICILAHTYIRTCACTYIVYAIRMWVFSILFSEVTVRYTVQKQCVSSLRPHPYIPSVYVCMYVCTHVPIPSQCVAVTYVCVHILLTVVGSMENCMVYFRCDVGDIRISVFLGKT